MIPLAGSLRDRVPQEGGNMKREYMLDDVIAAISTPMGVGGIGIVRMTDSLQHSPKAKNLTETLLLH